MKPEILELLGDADLSELRLSASEARAILEDWSLWRLPYQVPPPGDWVRWILRCGRGSGKTHTGARVTSEIAKDKNKIRNGEIGIIARTYSDARFTMIEGPSGILSVSPESFRPRWEPGNGVLIWPNGVRGRVASADRPESVRGLNLSWLWADEPAHWPDLFKTWTESIEPALRLGWARCLLTTTPIRVPDLRKLEELPGSVTTRAATFDNPYLPRAVRERLRELYAGTRTGLQELEGEYLTENERALWQADSIRRIDPPPLEAMRRIVVAVDPAVTNNEDSDETGIIVAGLGIDGNGYVFADRSCKQSPLGWARAACAARSRFKADTIVAEVNNGGDLVETTIRAVDPSAPVKSVRASRGKFVRAEPVAALYERGKVFHCADLRDLEDQQLNWDPSKAKSPDRLDALVWALTELMLSDGPGPIAGYL